MAFPGDSRNMTWRVVLTAAVTVVPHWPNHEAVSLSGFGP